VTHRSIANLGSFTIEITIEPVGPTGGGYTYSPPSRSTKYKIKIRVSRRGRVWEYEKLVSSTTANVFAKVINKKVVEPTVSIINTSMVEHKEPEIRVSIRK
jgi:hypothetical protein